MWNRKLLNKMIVGHLSNRCDLTVANAPPHAQRHPARVYPRARSRGGPGVETLVLVAVKPPWSAFHAVLVGPPLLALWIALSYHEYIPSPDVATAAAEEAPVSSRTRAHGKSKPE